MVQSGCGRLGRRRPGAKAGFFGPFGAIDRLRGQRRRGLSGRHRACRPRFAGRLAAQLAARGCGHGAMAVFGASGGSPQRGTRGVAAQRAAGGRGCRAGGRANLLRRPCRGAMGRWDAGRGGRLPGRECGQCHNPAPHRGGRVASIFRRRHANANRGGRRANVRCRHGASGSAACQGGDGRRCGLGRRRKRRGRSGPGDRNPGGFPGRQPGDFRDIRRGGSRRPHAAGRRKGRGRSGIRDGASRRFPGSRTENRHGVGSSGRNFGCGQPHSGGRRKEDGRLGARGFPGRSNLLGVGRASHIGGGRRPHAAGAHRKANDRCGVRDGSSHGFAGRRPGNLPGIGRASYIGGGRRPHAAGAHRKANDRCGVRDGSSHGFAGRRPGNLLGVRRASHIGGGRRPHTAGPPRKADDQCGARDGSSYGFAG